MHASIIKRVFIAGLFLLNQPAAAFAPGLNNKGVISSPLTRSSVLPTPSLFSAKSDLNLAENDINPGTDLTTGEDFTPSLSTRQSVQTVAYRASLLGATATYGFQIVLPVLRDAGLSIASTNDLITTVATAFAVAACALAPKAGSKSGMSVKLVDGKVLAASVVSLVAMQPLVGLAALFVREIYYFGLAYKVEAALGLTASLAVLLLPGDVSVPTEASNAAACLALAVLVFGKFLEPLEEDWKPNQSEFLARDALK